MAQATMNSNNAEVVVLGYKRKQAEWTKLSRQ